MSLTVTPDLELPGKKRVAISWRVLSVDPNKDWIRVFNADPANDREAAVLYAFPVNVSSGRANTDLMIESKTLRRFCHNGVFQSQCYEYWAAFARDGVDSR